MNVKAQKAVNRKAKNIDREELGRLLLQILPRTSGRAQTEEFKERLREEFGETVEPSGAPSRVELERAAHALLAQLQEHRMKLTLSAGSRTKTNDPQSVPGSPLGAFEGHKPTQRGPRSLDHFRFEHPAIITQRLRRLPAKSLEVELNQLKGEVARQVRFLIWQSDSDNSRGMSE